MILSLASFLILVYFVLMELQMMVLAVLSVRSLRRDRLIEKHGRIDDLLSSDLTPPVSIIVPAYNEAAGIVHPVHNELFDVDERCMPVGAAMQVLNALAILEG